MRQVVQTSQFKQDLKKIKRSNRFYQFAEDKLVLVRTGSHSELF